MVVEYNCINKSHLGVKYMSNKTFGMHAATCDRVVLVSVGAVFTEKIADQNCQFCKFLKKSKNGRFCTAKSAP